MKKIQEFLLNFSYNAPITLSYFFLCFGVIISNYITKGRTNTLLFSTYRSNIKDFLLYPRLFLHICGHANWEHFMNNFLYILILGPMLEEKFGSKNLLFFMLITALITGIIHNCISKKILCGASGVVFLFITLSSFVNLETNKIPITLVLVSVLFLLNELIHMFIKKDNTSHLTHFIGAVIGIIIGFIFGGII